MTHERALVWAVGSFVFFACFAVGLFAALEVRMVFLPGPLVAIGAASYGVYLFARNDR